MTTTLSNEKKESVENVLKLQGVIGALQFNAMSGDASNREYFKVNSENKSWVLMSFDSSPQSIAEEKTKLSDNTISETPFVNVQRVFQKYEVRVPKIIGEGPGYILLEDLGDQLLYDTVDHSKNVLSETATKLYLRSLEELWKIQSIPLDENNFIATKKCFDEELYHWEFMHFVEYGLEWLLGNLGKEKKALTKYFRSMSQQMARFPACVVHRDYHSKNLMVVDDSIIVIDFQDALIGSAHYDLASLLYDAYVLLDDKVIDHFVTHFYQNSNEDTVGDSLDQFHQELSMVGLHRALKAAGRFIFIFAEKHRKTHLQYFLPALHQAQRHLEKLGAASDFTSLLRLNEVEEAFKDRFAGS